MKYCSDEQNKNEIIRGLIKTEIKKGEFEYEIEYMDYSREPFYYTEERLKKLEEKIINQAIKRDKLDYEYLHNEKWNAIILWIASNVLLNVSYYKENLFYMCCAGIQITFFIIKYIRTIKHINELKKYRILLENYKEIKENPNINKCIFFDTIYEPNLDIFSVDNYSLNNMLTIEKELKKSKKLNG